MSSIKDFEKAKNYQLNWMSQVRNFLDGSIIFNNDNAVSFENSELGKWYYKEAKEKYINLLPIEKFETKQIKSHEILKEILQAKAENQTELAEELYEELVTTSNFILDLLKTAEEYLKKVAEEEALMQENFVKNYNVGLAWDKSKILQSKTDPTGVIEYVNDVFLEVSGYNSIDLINKPHNVVRHPDMPKVIFKVLWDRINQGKPSYTIIKNRSKSGKYYWTNVFIKINTDKTGKVESISATHKGIDMELINKFIEPLYKQLLEIETQGNIKIAENYLKGFLEEKNRSFDDYILNLIKTGKDNPNTEQKGFLGGLLGY